MWKRIDGGAIQFGILDDLTSTKKGLKIILVIILSYWKKILHKSVTAGWDACSLVNEIIIYEFVLKKLCLFGIILIYKSVLDRIILNERKSTQENDRV